MSVLIISFPEDVHAVAVLLALEKIGVKTDLFFCGDLPEKSTISLSPNTGHISITGPSILSGGNTYNSVWNRRMGRAQAPLNSHASDKYYIETNGSVYIDNVFSFDESTLWVNPALAQRRIDNKAYQLRLAEKCGFKVPQTLISNNPKDVLDFVSRFSSAIVKPIMPMNWQLKSSGASVFTTDIDLEMLNDEESISLCPMIYQNRIDKLTEYRIVAIGEEIICFDLNSQKNEGTRLDWRSTDHSSLDIQMVECEPDLEFRIREFMRASELRFGAFDFALDLNGEFVFFEVNEQGQFLWIEQAIPDCRLLDRFAHFLAHADQKRKHGPSDLKVSLDDLLGTGEIQAKIQHLKSSHCAFHPKVYVDES